MGEYDKALICRNGHVVNSSAASLPERNTKFCGKCGAATIDSCDKCYDFIRGYYRVEGVIGFFEYSPPSFCEGCGAPFPWTEARLKALKDLVAASGASVEEAQGLSEALPALTSEVPGTPVAVLRWKRFFAGTGKDVISFAREILVVIAAEAVKHQLFGP